MNKFNYILNDLALSNLITRCLYSKNADCSDKEELKNQIILIQQENKILKENAENNDKVVDKVNWENQLLKKENKQLKMIIEEYERLNKQNDRGFKITNVQEYNIDELLNYKKYKNNWNKLKEYLHNQIPTDKTVLTKHIKIFEVLDKMQELEQGSDSNE